MGCGGSKKNEHGRNSLAEKQIAVHIGDGVKAAESGSVLIFVFGGPGSRKGRMVSELVETYGFSFINVEKVLLNHLLKKVPEADRVGASFDVQDVIKEDPQLVSLHWLLGEVSRQIDQNSCRGASRFIVDIMPNLKFLINNDIFLAECTNDMNAFEQEHPITFALNFIQRSAKKHKKEPDGGKDKEEKPRVQSDEADSSRTRRRITLFENNVQPFIDYFQQSERLVSLDVTGAQLEAVWAKLCEVFAGLNVHSLSHVNYILVFIFDPGELEQVNLEQGNIQTVKLKTLVDENTAALMTDTLSALCMHLNKSDPSIRTFLIDVSDTCLTSQSQQQVDSNAVVFVDEEMPRQLTKFIPRNKSKGGNTAVKFRAVSSTENRVCLFPCHVPMTLCKQIAVCLGNNLQH
ncbi:uncharacterized protein [Littorina saxatilis]|uniref:Adenylate kinase n=1 Tax=Littorina saxatilis TaxID=31220 RepID=A0AAN9G8I2_9CAEN